MVREILVLSIKTIVKADYILYVNPFVMKRIGIESGNINIDIYACLNNQ